MRIRNLLYLIISACALVAIVVAARSIYDQTFVYIDFNNLNELERGWIVPYIEGIAKTRSLKLLTVSPTNQRPKTDLSIRWAEGNLKKRDQTEPELSQAFLADPYGLYISKTIEAETFMSEWVAFIAPDALPRKQAIYTSVFAGNDDQTLIGFVAAIIDAAYGPQAASQLFSELKAQTVINSQGMIEPSSQWYAAVEILRQLSRSGVIPSDFSSWDAVSVFRSLRDGKTATAFASFSERATYAVLEHGNLSFKPLPADGRRTNHSVVARVLEACLTELGQTRQAATKLVTALAAGGSNPAPYSWQKPVLEFGSIDGGRLERGYKAWLSGAMAVLAVGRIDRNSYTHHIAEALRREARR